MVNLIRKRIKLLLGYNVEVIKNLSHNSNIIYDFDYSILKIKKNNILFESNFTDELDDLILYLNEQKLQ